MSSEQQLLACGFFIIISNKVLVAPAGWTWTWAIDRSISTSCCCLLLPLPS